MEIKRCTTCKENKNINEYSKDKSTISGLKSHCKKCAKEYNRLSNIKFKDNIRFRRIKKTYNLTKEEYNLMIFEQDNKCFICGKEEYDRLKTGEIRPLSIDHCHKTNKNGKLLCNSCNISLGLIKDDVNILEKMILYIKKYR